MSPGVVLFRLPLLAVLVLLVSGPRIASAQETVTVSGRVVNGTAGANLPQSLTIALHSFDREDGLVVNTKATADDVGRFQFDEVPLREEWSYAVSVDYAGVLYSAVLSPGQLSDQVQLTVYETTQDVAVLGVSQQVLVISEVNEKEREIAAVEFVVVLNDSDRTLLPDLSNVGQMSFLRFSLPPQAAGLNVQSDLPGGDIIDIGTGFAITAPVLPGEHNINFSFRFPYRGDTASYRQNLLQGAELYQVLVPERLAQIQVYPLRQMPPADINGSVYRVWEVRDFNPGEGLTLELTRLPQPSLLARLERLGTDGTFWQITIPSVVGATLAFLLLYSVFKAPQGVSSPSEPGGPERRDGNAGRREVLVQTVATLDEEFQQGQVLEDEYQARRERLKAGIREVSKTEEYHQGESGG